MTRHSRPQHGHCSATILPGGLRYDAECAWLGAGSRFNNCIMAERGRPCVTMQCSQGLRYGAQNPATRRRGAATRATACNTARAHGFGARCVAIQAATRPTRPATQPATSHDTAGHRPTTRPQHGRPGRSARGLCAQAWPGCAPGARNPVLTQCTVLSHCLGQWSQDFFQVNIDQLSITNVLKKFIS